jgi:RNA polymerase sigma-70 factor (sigma-E family)
MFGLPTPTRDAEFAEFVTAATPSLSWTALLLTGNRASAAELLQEGFLRTYLAWPRVRRADAIAYTRRTLVNLSIDINRTRPAPPVEVFDHPDRRDAEAEFDNRDELLRMLAGLPQQQRRVIVLRYFEDLTEAATAECLGISLGAVKSAASRGLATLRDAYAPIGGEQ